jgi:TP901 family phage tail tape measure protein
MSGRFTVETVFKGTDNTSSVLSSIQAKTKAVQGALSGPVHAADSALEGFKKVGAVAAVAGLAAGAAFHQMVETGADFEQSITNVGAVMGKTRGQIGDLEKAALSLGVSTQFSASQVSEVMEMMAKKGFDAEEILAGIPGVLDAIAASGEDAAQVSTIVGSTIRGFGLEAKDAAMMADLLAYAGEKTGAGILNMGTAMAMAAPTARALGVSAAETAAAVGLLQKMGIDASTAGTATATMLAKISHPSKEAAQKMTAMGVAFKDAKGNMLPLHDVLGQFVKAGDKAGGNMDKMSFFAELVGLRGDKAALGLSEMAKSGDFDKLVAGLKNTENYAHRVATIRMDTTMGSWKLLTSTVEVLETKIFSLNNGGFKVAIDKVNAWVSANQGLIVSGATEYAGKLTDKVVELAGSIDKGVMRLGWFKDGLDNAFKNSTSVKVFGTAIDAVFGGSDSAGPGKKAYDLGHGIGYAVDKLILFTGVVKTAEGAVWLFSNATKVCQGITLAYRGVVAGITAVQTLYTLATGSGFGATVAFGGSMTAAALQAGELALAEEAATLATGELAIAEEAAAAGAAEVAVTAGAAEAGIAGIGAAAAAAVVPLAAAAAAAAALYAAYSQNEGLKKATGGKGVLDVGWEWATTNKGLKEIADENLDAQARDEAARRDPVTANRGSRPDPMGFGYGGPSDTRPPGPYADGYVPPGAPPQLVPLRGDDGNAQSSAQLKASIDALAAKLNANGGTVKLILPKGVSAEKSGAPGVEVNQSGGF